MTFNETKPARGALILFVQSHNLRQVGPDVNRIPSDVEILHFKYKARLICINQAKSAVIVAKVVLIQCHYSFCLYAFGLELVKMIDTVKHCHHHHHKHSNRVISVISFCSGLLFLSFVFVFSRETWQPRSLFTLLAGRPLSPALAHVNNKAKSSDTQQPRTFHT